MDDLDIPDLDSCLGTHVGVLDRSSSLAQGDSSSGLSSTSHRRTAAVPGALAHANTLHASELAGLCAGTGASITGLPLKRGERPDARPAPQSAFNYSQPSSHYQGSKRSRGPQTSRPDASDHGGTARASQERSGAISGITTPIKCESEQNTAGAPASTPSTSESIEIESKLDRPGMQSPSAVVGTSRMHAESTVCGSERDPASTANQDDAKQPGRVGQFKYNQLVTSGAWLESMEGVGGGEWGSSAGTGAQAGNFRAWQQLRDLIKAVKGHKSRGESGYSSLHSELLVCAVAALQPGTHGAVCTLVDGSGQAVAAWIQQAAVIELGRSLDQGSVLTLRGVPMIEPAAGRHYLCITPRSIIRVLPPTTVYKARRPVESKCGANGPD